MVSFPMVKQILLYQVVQFELAMSKIKLHVCFRQIIYWRDGIPSSCSYPYSAAIQRYGEMKGGVDDLGPSVMGLSLRPFLPIRN